MNAAKDAATTPPPPPTPEPSPSPAPALEDPPAPAATIACTVTVWDKSGYKGRLSAATGETTLGNAVCLLWSPMGETGKAESMKVSCTCTGANCPTTSTPVMKIYDNANTVRLTAETTCSGTSCTKEVSNFGSASNVNQYLRMCFDGAS